MAKPLIECVPNFSEGRNTESMKAIVAPFKKRKGCVLLDYRADKDHNRMVVSLVGDPDPIQEALLEAAKVAVERIDMERHEGEHPRIGAVDVIPFIPLRNIGMNQVVEISHAFGQRYYEETGIPVYYYEEAAIRPERRFLEVLRRGQYETLKKEIQAPERHPDVGEPKLHPRAGATVIGARKFLIAFNVNLATSDICVAKEIAKTIRASSGGLSSIKAIGLSLKERGLVQVSINVIDYEKNALYRILELIRMEAKRWGVDISDTEVYGMIPAAALLDSAAYYLQTREFNANQVIELALLEHMDEGA